MNAPRPPHLYKRAPVYMDAHKWQNRSSVRQFKWALTSRQMFKWQKETRPDTLTDIQRTARFYYLIQNCFSGKLERQTFGTATTASPGLNLLRLEETLSASHLRLALIYVEHFPWLNCVKCYDRLHTLFYMDPPCWNTVGYGVEFGIEQYAAMADSMQSIKGRALVSVNDQPKMREVFARFAMQVLDIRYTFEGGRRGCAARLVADSELGRLTLIFTPTRCHRGPCAGHSVRDSDHRRAGTVACTT